MRIKRYDNLVLMVHPTHYSLHLEPNLETFKFKGNSVVDMESETAVSEVTLHTLEIEYHDIKVKIGEDLMDVKYSEDKEKQELHLQFPKASSKFSVHFDYTGEHNDKLAGFYRSKFMVDGKEQYVAVTQFQANDARRAFPCVDIPGVKATYDIEFLVNPDQLAISNMPIAEYVSKGDQKLVKFHRTPKMSSYLVFFAVGNFDYITKKSKGRDYRVLTAPGKADAHGRLALDWGVDVIEFCEKYFDFPYPLPKLDQMATPDFAAGAMENWGAILYRENALLYYEGVTSETQKNGIIGVIAHELTHQWFGNLVSPKTWKYIWLNESFATFFPQLIMDHYFPERRVVEYFVQSTNLGRRSRSTMGVMDWDSMIKTSPIEIAGDGEISFTAKTVPILYTKGGSILRQIQGFLGPEYFRDGLRAYFKKHAYGASVSNYLWESLGEVSGMPVSDVMQSFVLQKGIPLVSVRRDGNILKLTQSRFTYLSHEEDTIWNIPVTIKVFSNGEERHERFVFDMKEAEFDLGEHETYKLNTDLTGYYRTEYPTDDLAMLGKLVSEKKISALDRVNIEDDLFAMVKAGRTSLESYLGFVENYSSDDSHMPMFNIAVHLLDIYNLLEDGEKKDAMKERSKNFIDTILDKISIEPKSGDDLGVSIIRGSLINAACRLGSDKAKSYVMSEFEKIKNGDSVDANLRATILAVAARETNDYNWFKTRFDNPSSETDFINTINAMTGFTENEMIEKVKDLVFTEIPRRNRGFAIGGLAANKVIKDELWEWYIANLDSFESMNNFMFQNSIVAIVSASEKSFGDMKSFFEDYLKKNPRTSDAVDVGMEQLEIMMSFKKLLN